MQFVIFSHLRWNFVYQRPQHLMSRCGRDNEVYFWEEPIFEETDARLEMYKSHGVNVAVPHLQKGWDERQIEIVQGWMLQQMLEERSISDCVFWYYTPLALAFTREFYPQLTVYDCMDELSAFRGAPLGLRAAERELFSRADLVFTGGHRLHESKRNRHPSVHCFPSSIDREFFAKARSIRAERLDQQDIPRPRLGYCGVIDERMDMNLIREIAEARPDWNLIMLGPIVKVSESELPRRSNVFYLGAKDYQELPSYLSGWDVGLLPFALNESTRFISPTKTPEYLAAGLPVVSSAITDVVKPYGENGLVEIAMGTEQFIKGIERTLAVRNSSQRLAKVDEFLSHNSWDKTWRQMFALLTEISSFKKSEPEMNKLLVRTPSKLAQAD